MITGLEPFAIKWVIGHVGHALAAKGVFAAQHPVSTATNMAVHHGVTSLISNATVPAATKLPYVPFLNHAATAAVLSHGATGAAAAPSAPVTLLHDAAKVAIPVVTWAVWQQVRKSELYREAKDALSELLTEAMATPSDRLGDGESASLSGIRQQSA